MVVSPKEYTHTLCVHSQAPEVWTCSLTAYRRRGRRRRRRRRREEEEEVEGGNGEGEVEGKVISVASGS